MIPSRKVSPIRLAAWLVVAMLLLATGLPGPAIAQEEVVPPPGEGLPVSPQSAIPPGNEADQASPRAATGGAPTLEDILARQRGEVVSNDFRRAAESDAAANAESLQGQLGTLGGASDADIFRQIRFGTGDVSVTTYNPIGGVLIQDGGMRWLEWRKGPVLHYGLYAIAGIVLLLGLFFLVRGRIRIEGGRSGIKIERFDHLERFSHWLLAGSFVVLALTGIFQLAGRQYLIPLIGHEVYAAIAAPGKWVHNNIAWAFMVGLVLVLVMWIARNLPTRADVVWLLKGGGMFTKNSHAPAHKFNAGQKILFWLVILLGGSVSLSGLSLLFPFDLPLFSHTFHVINAAGELVGLDLGLPTELQPQEEMQYAQVWHVIVAFAMIVMIIGHIYIGTIGMEGAFDAMGTGDVDLNWAREHHGLWVEEEIREGGRGAAYVGPSEAH